MSGTSQDFTVFEIPLAGIPEQFTLTLGGVLYRMTVQWREAGGTGWILDIDDQNGAAIAHGLPLSPGLDLLEQLAYLGIGGKLFVQTDGDIAAPPTFDNLGITCHLYYAAQNA